MKLDDSHTPLVVSLFSGAGGLDEGFNAAGFNIYASMDIEDWACNTLRQNNPSSIVVGPPNNSGDIKKISPKDFSQIIGLSQGDVDVMIGGPPCQPFSLASSQRFLKGDNRFKRKGFSDSLKGTLIFDYLSYIKFFKPTVFVIENVPGLLTMDGGAQIKEILVELHELGYKTTVPEIINAVSYGVPQYRERFILWGTLKTEVDPLLPEFTHSSDLFGEPYNCVCQVLSDIPANVENHVLRNHNQETINRYRQLYFGEREQLGRVDRLDPLAPSKTVIAGGMNGGGRSHLHPFVARTLSVRECARLQTFQDDYVFSGTMSRQFTQVGNAVPPLLAEHIARQIGNQVFGKIYSGPFIHEKHISTEPKEVLVSRMVTNALQEHPEWIYFTHTTK